MRVLVCGSRNWDLPELIEQRLRRLPPGSEVIHGGARGADQQAAAIARRLGFQVVEYPADWRGEGRSAGVLRNLRMLDEWPDLVLAFWRDHSTGTAHTIAEAHRRGIAVEVCELVAL